MTLPGNRMNGYCIMEKKSTYKKIYVKYDEDGKPIPLESGNHPAKRGWMLTPDRITNLSERSSWKKGKDLSPDKDFWEK